MDTLTNHHRMSGTEVKKRSQGGYVLTWIVFLMVIGLFVNLMSILEQFEQMGIIRGSITMLSDNDRKTCKVITGMAEKMNYRIPKELQCKSYRYP